MADASSLMTDAGAVLAGKASGIGNMIAAIISGRKAKKLSKQSTDEWKSQMGWKDNTIPESYGEQKTYYKDLLGLSGREQMPGYSQAKQEIESSTAAGLGQLGQLGEGADVMAGLLGMQQQRQTALRQLGIAASQYQSQQQNQARQNYGQVIGQGAQYEQQAFDYNTWLPQQMKWNQQMGLSNQAQQMGASGFDQLMGAEIQGANLASQQMWYDRMSPQAQQPSTQSSQGQMNPYWNPTV